MSIGKSRRTFLKQMTALSTLAPLSRAGLMHTARGSPKKGRQVPNQLKGRKRRIIWNNDGSDMLANAYARGTWPVPLKSAEQFIGNLMQYVLGTEVDSIFYCAHVNEPDWEIPLRNIEALGPNPVKHVVNFAHQHRMEFFYSIRMNDVHASYWPPNRSYWVPFRMKHPELLLGYTTAQEFEKRFLPWIRRFLELERENQARGIQLNQEQLTELRLLAEKEHPLADVLRRQGQFSRDLWAWAS
jgi:hypothetical protein